MPPAADKSADDSVVREVVDALSGYRADHPRATVEVYRQNSASIRVRIIDTDFSELNRDERDTCLWKVLEKISRTAQRSITMLLLLTPNEADASLANFEFENRSRSRL